MSPGGNGLKPQTFEDIARGLALAEDCIRRIVGVPFNAQTARLRRLDANADFRIRKGRARAFIESLPASVPRTTRARFDRKDMTQQFGNGSRTITVYDKAAEVWAQYRRGRATLEDVEAAGGLLRVEHQLRKPQAIAAFAEKAGVRADDGSLLRPGVAELLVADALSRLKLDRPRPTGGALCQRLREHFGGRAAEMLGVLLWREREGEDFWRALRWSRRKYFRLKGELQKAGCWDAPHDSVETLPALCIDPRFFGGFSSAPQEMGNNLASVPNIALTPPTALLPGRRGLLLPSPLRAIQRN